MKPVADTLGLPRIAWLLAAMVAATLPFLTSLPPWMPLAILAVGGWRWWGERRGIAATSRTMRVLIAAIVVGLLLASGHLGFGLEAATPLFIAFLWIKLLELRSERDYLLACFLCYFLVAVLLFSQQSLLTCMYALLSLAIITVAAVRYHAGREARSILPLVATMTVQAIPLALVVFMFCPRMQVRLPNLGGQGMAGFTDTMRPGDIAKVATSDQVAFRVEFPDGRLPPAEQLYWRGLVMNETDGNSWHYRAFGDERTRSPRASADEARLPVYTQEVVLMPHNLPFLFALENPISQPEEARLHANRLLSARGGPVTRVTRYTVTSRPGHRATDLGELTVCRQVPTRLREQLDPLAHQLTGTATSVQGKVDALLDHFHTAGFNYSLEPGEMGDDAIATFLLERKSGFCAHYATGFCVLMRLANVSTRVVLGYRGGEANAFGNFLVVRQAHAHAWCEVWDNARWIHVDPTAGLQVAPGQSIPAAQAGSGATTTAPRDPGWAPEWLREPLRDVRQWWQYVDARWDGLAMGYDAEQQERFLARFGLDRLGLPAAIGVLVVLIGLLLGGLFALMRIRYRRRGDPVLDLYADFCTRLRRGGVEREAWEGPLDYAQRAIDSFPEHEPAIRAAANLYVRLRYGDSADRTYDLAHFARLVRQLNSIGGITQRIVRSNTAKFFKKKRPAAAKKDSAPPPPR